MAGRDGGQRERVPVHEERADDGLAVALDRAEAVAAARADQTARGADGQHVPAVPPHPSRPQRDRPVLGVPDGEGVHPEDAAQVRRQLVGDLDGGRARGAGGDERRVLDEGPPVVVRQHVDERRPARRQPQVGEHRDVGVERRA